MQSSVFVCVHTRVHLCMISLTAACSAFRHRINQTRHFAAHYKFMHTPFQSLLVLRIAFFGGRIHFLFCHPILTLCEKWQRKEQENTSWNTAQPVSPLPAQQYPHCLAHEAISRTDDTTFSSLPVQTQRATWSPLRASKQPFKHHISSHTVKTQPDLLGQQHHHTSTHSSTCTLPTPHPALPGFTARALTHTQLWRSSTILVVQPGTRLNGGEPLQVLCFIQPLQVSGSRVSPHTLQSALSHPAWVMPTIWQGKYVLSANVIHSLINPL